MIKAFNFFDLWSQRDKDVFGKFTQKLNDQQDICDEKVKRNVFQIWTEATAKLRKIQLEKEQKEKVVDILKKSVRGQRTTVEKEILRRFVISNLTCVPKSVSFSEMDQLCNELDWIPLVGRSILFLQGDFGNIYYMIASGTVGLFLEPSKDREMTIAREFGSLRAQPFKGTDDDLKGLGNNIFNLPQGAGFGEYAILASSNKIRSCAAVAMSEDSMLLIMHAETYNAVLRQHHYRQKQLSSATALLSELPLFKAHNYSKIASIAYTMRSQTYSSQSIIASYGQVINNVILIVSGQVKVFAAPVSSSRKESAEGEEDKVSKIIEKRIPRLAVSMLGRGQIIGELEMHKNFRTFQMTYEAGSASTEVLEMPSTVYKESVGGAEFRQSQIYKTIEESNDLNEQRRAGRLARAYDAMKNMMGGSTREVKSKDELLSVLPVIIDPYSSAGSMNNSFQISSTRRNVSTKLSFNNPDVLKVTRKPSFNVTLSPDETLSPKEMAALVHRNNHMINHGGSPVRHQSHQAVTTSPSAPQGKSSFSGSLQSPRTASIKATLPSKRL